MKTFIFFIALITFPVLTFGQNASSENVEQNTIVSIKAISINELTENTIAFHSFSKTEVTNLNYKKSIDLTSIKAYRKSLQIKVKEVRMC